MVFFNLYNVIIIGRVSPSKNPNLHMGYHSTLNVNQSVKCRFPPNVVNDDTSNEPD